MPFILYLETNFLMSFAEGRDQAVNDLLMAFPPVARLVIPGVCFMEAYSTLVAIKKAHSRFLEEFRGKIKEIDRGIVWLDGEVRVESLQLALLDVASDFDRKQRRLRMAVELIALRLKNGQLAETIGMSADCLLASRLIPDATNNLILAGILIHAKDHPDATKAFLPENRKDFELNTEAKQALNDAGVKYFSNTQACIDWLGSRSSP